MADSFEAKEHIIGLAANPAERAAKTPWLESLRRWLVQCPQCSEVRLVVGARENDRYTCKHCGCDLVIGMNHRGLENRI